jgi:MerR family transcriptional regulator, light-induced transcriptional regulator
MLRLGTFEETQFGARLSERPLAFSPCIVAETLGTQVNGRPTERSDSPMVEQLCAALVGDAPGQALAHLERLLDCGVGIDAIYETFIPRAAMRLGELWVEDVLSFTAVTLGMARLTEAFRSLSPVFMKTRRPVRRERRVLFALMPGEDHSLGVVLAADHFQRAGWSVQVELQAAAEAIVDLAAAQHYQLVGLSAGSRRMLPALDRLVARLREVTGPETALMVGGALTALEPDLGRRLGVEAGEGSARAVLDRMERAAA